jgi:uncharacterized protein YeaO (DUF488 family)
MLAASRPSARRRPRFEVRRVYEDAPGRGVHRVLVDRLWPRGMAKADAPIDEWAKDVAPSTGLRRWYGHEPDKFAEFATRYRAELRRAPAGEEVVRLRRQATQTPVLLMTATRDVEHSGAQVLLGVLTERR